VKRRAVMLASAAVIALGLSEALRPRQRISSLLPPIDLERQVPAAFEDWRVDKSIIPVLPNAEVQARLDVLYGQVLARTYVDAGRNRVMLSIAYGADQGTDATAAHRPEFCYAAQGFSVRVIGRRLMPLNDHQILVNQLIGKMAYRNEPITYWVTLNDTAVLPGIRRKLAQIRLGLEGVIPDGMLVRVSTIGEDASAGFALQERFLQGLQRNLPAALRPRYFGAASA
jgi:EpsI family protein